MGAESGIEQGAGEECPWHLFCAARLERVLPRAFSPLPLLSKSFQLHALSCPAPVPLQTRSLLRSALGDEMVDWETGAGQKMQRAIGGSLSTKQAILRDEPDSQRVGLQMRKEKGYASLGVRHGVYDTRQNRLSHHLPSPSQIECLDQSPSKCRKQSHSVEVMVGEEKKRAKTDL